MAKSPAASGSNSVAGNSTRAISEIGNTFGGPDNATDAVVKRRAMIMLGMACSIYRGTGLLNKLILFGPKAEMKGECVNSPYGFVIVLICGDIHRVSLTWNGLPMSLNCQSFAKIPRNPNESLGISSPLRMIFTEPEESVGILRNP